jgi:L-ascorbate metabolism protein UlaG (beta-lactamase superfamily)/pimeloyl-ACP methyl ester carboxylesterase
MGHGFGANLSMMEGYAKSFAENGIAAYVFDFIGGGHDIKSDGKMTEMSVLTEAADMNTVLDGILALDIIDKNNIFAMGGSQGGFVATYIAGTRPEDIKGLIALYPAYVLQDDAGKRTGNGTEFFDTFSVMGNTISRLYDEDALSFDIYDIMKNFKGNALLIHGTADQIVPYSYSERAVDTLPSARLITIEGAGHGFGGKDDEYATRCAIDFVKEEAGITENSNTDEKEDVMITDKIRLFTQNSIRIESDAGIIYVDPFKMNEEPHDADFILLTHNHYDHFSPEDILKVCKESSVMIVPENMESEAGDLTDSVDMIYTVEPDMKKNVNGLELETIPAYNNSKSFHQKSAGWVGYILTIDGKRVYIAGDTDMTEDNRKVKCDVAMIPIGGTYTMDAMQAAQLINEIKPDIAIPTHYGSAVGSPKDADTFKEQVNSDIEVVIKMEY